MTTVQTIKSFFEADGGRKVDLAEFRKLSTQERDDLGQLCGKALGLTRKVDDKSVTSYE